MGLDVFLNMRIFAYNEEVKVEVKNEEEKGVDAER